MRILGFAALFIFCGAGIAGAQTVSRTPCDSAHKQCAARVQSAAANGSKSTAFRTQYYPYQHYSITTGPYGTYNTRYYPYLNSSTTITPYGSYTTRYGFQQQCSIDNSGQTIRC
jgi:hypothetical protein